MLVPKWANWTQLYFEIIEIEDFQLQNLDKEAAGDFEFGFMTLFNHKSLDLNVKTFQVCKLCNNLRI